MFGFWNGAVITSSLLLERRYQRWEDALHINDKSVPWRVFMTARTALLVFLGRYLTRAPRLLTALALLRTTFTRPMLSQLTDGTLLHLGLTGWDLGIVAVGILAVNGVEFYQERGGHVREALARKSAFVQWLAIAVPLVILVVFGIFRAGYIASEFIYGQF